MAHTIYRVMEQQGGERSVILGEYTNKRKAMGHLNVKKRVARLAKWTATIQNEWDAYFITNTGESVGYWIETAKNTTDQPLGWS